MTALPAFDTVDGARPDARPTVGALLRDWRQRRRLSQLDLALEADISTRHLSFVETGRASPSRDMILHLAERLDVPLRERNALLVAAGFAPMYDERPLHDPAMACATRAIELVLAGHEPFPALAVDRHWTMITANRAVAPLLAGCAPELLRPPVNVLRLSLHPQGLAPRIANHAQWRDHLLERLRRQWQVSADPVIAALLDELSAYPAPPAAAAPAADGDVRAAGHPAVAIPMQLVNGDELLSFYSTTTVFGTPIDVTLSELAIEAFFPADRSTTDALNRMARLWRAAQQ
ncbi:MAG: helix-turn-helix transcriptional regulator [Burkholderiaceae bacterium]